MLYGVVDYSTQGSTLVDPFVIADQQAKAAEAAAIAAQRQTAQPQGSSTGWVVLLAGICAGYYYLRSKNAGKRSGTDEGLSV